MKYDIKYTELVMVVDPYHLYAIKAGIYMETGYFDETNILPRHILKMSQSHFNLQIFRGNWFYKI